MRAKITAKISEAIIMSDTCSINCQSRQIINDNQKKIAAYRDLGKATDFYKLLGNQTRLKIMLILINAELCVCDIAESIGLSVPATSQQLKMLKQAGILAQRNEGKTVYYSYSAPETENLLSSLLFNLSD